MSLRISQNHASALANIQRPNATGSKSTVTVNDFQNALDLNTASVSQANMASTRSQVKDSDAAMQLLTQTKATMLANQSQAAAAQLGKMPSNISRLLQ